MRNSAASSDVGSAPRLPALHAPTCQRCCGVSSENSRALISDEALLSQVGVAAFERVQAVRAAHAAHEDIAVDELIDHR